MSSPVDDRPEPQYNGQAQRSSDDDGTVIGDDTATQEKPEAQAHAEAYAHAHFKPRSHSHLTVQTDYSGIDPLRSAQSPSQTRERAHRLDDELTMLQIERKVSQQEDGKAESQTRSLYRSRSRREEPTDEFDTATNPLHERAAVYHLPENPTTSLAKLFKKVHESSFIVRYCTYITPVVLIILIPLLLGALVFKKASVGGVKLVWFCIWLEIVWLTLWAGRVSVPFPIFTVSQ